MKKTLFLITIFISLSLKAQSDDIEKAVLENNNCYSCHKENEYLPEDFNEEDIHIKAGISCADCHGGDINSDDEDEAMSAAKGFVGVPSRRGMPEFCGKCHSNIEFMKKYNPRMETDQVARYFTSVHGKQLKKGDKNVAVCTNCHTAHSIFPAKDPRSTVYAINVPSTCNKCHGKKELMSKYDLPFNVYNEYARGIHGIALLKNKDTGAPACNDCHGNHGAAPPGVSSINYVCGLCHVNNLNYFNASTMGKAFIKKDYHGCVECHGNHNIEKPTDDFVGTTDESFCINCHSDGDKGLETAKEIHNSITELKSILDTAKIKLVEVKRKGMNDEDIEFILKEVNQNLIQARTIVHTFDTSKVNEKTRVGKKAGLEAIAKAEAEIDDYFTRRNGFLAATAVISIFTIGLFLKIREMSKNKKS